MQVTDKMVSRFLMWRLPDDFMPDCGIHFEVFHPNGKTRFEPVGTNLLTAEQARAMLEHVLAESHQLPLTLEQARDVVRGAFEVRPEMCGDDLVLIRAAEKAHGIEGPNVRAKPALPAQEQR